MGRAGLAGSGNGEAQAVVGPPQATAFGLVTGTCVSVAPGPRRRVARGQ